MTDEQELRIKCLELAVSFWSTIHFRDKKTDVRDIVMETATKFLDFVRASDA